MSAKCQYMGWEGDRVKNMLEGVEEKYKGLWSAIEKINSRNRENQTSGNFVINK